ncbi:hypothetical protein PIB30_080893 [Stylosanthes scabra]|uniref:Uncharacterized protein n=1 Tax=Stylosanthes scabra TaxID=79078 RepID=A0ABU6SS04_9FABA|nr:hypothetical protein [Stylosanthes scabra]
MAVRAFIEERGTFREEADKAARKESHERSREKCLCLTSGIPQSCSPSLPAASLACNSASPVTIPLSRRFNIPSPSLLRTLLLLLLHCLLLSPCALAPPRHMFL